jgi:uracil-DNA glycosylase
MAIKTNKAKGITAVKSKEKSLYQMKLMSGYIISQDVRLLNRLCLEQEITKSNALKYRAISHLVPYPKILWYINKYLNNWFDIDSSDFRMFLFTISCICKQHRIDNLNKLFFTKFKIEETAEFISLLNKYYEQLELGTLSNGEISAYLHLYKAGIITEAIISRMDFLINGSDKAPVIVTNTFTPNVINIKNSDCLSFDKLPIKIKEYCSMVTGYIKSKCVGCQLYKKTPIILDTNLQDLGPVDILILGYSPNDNEISSGLPFTNNSGQIFRKYLMPLIQKYNLSYIFTNCILCTTNDGQEISKLSDVIKKCKPIVDEIRRNFPTKLTIIVGNESKTSVGIKGPISKCNGEIIDGYFITLDPATISNNSKTLLKFENTFQKLDIKLSELKVVNLETELEDLQTDVTINLPPDKIITRFTNDLTLFDIKLINENVIYIMKNENGQKKYLIEKFSMPIYLKHGEYKDCHLIESNVDYVCLLTSENRAKLTKMLYYQNFKKE